MAVGPDDTVVVTGRYAGDGFDPGSGALPFVYGGTRYTTFEELFIARYSPSGALLWGSSRNSASRDFGDAVAVDATGNIVYAGMGEGSLLVARRQP